MNYRPDIDGLRGLAVLAVVLFHADLDSFSGGFVGVDIFFVISGYLITALITEDIRQGRFSLLAFYERRIRRILPALFAVLACSAVAAALLLMPEEFESFGRSLVAATLFASNILFWQESGYFDAPAETKPLLHTWSLAVEEQFYIVFPLFLLFVFRFLKGRWVAWTLPVVLISFALSVWGVEHRPEATFYLAPTRAWELLLGALLALGVVPPLRGPHLRETAALLGMGLIAWSVFTFSSQTPFPGPQALLPSVGAALLIHAGASGPSWVGRRLSTRPAVFVGLISYSLYLWHWPLLVFAKSYAIRALSAAETAAVVALAVVAAILSWHLIERPFRTRGGVVARPGLFGGVAAVMMALAAFGVVGHATEGWPQRYSQDVVTIAAGENDFNPDRAACHSMNPERILQGELCLLGPPHHRPQFIVWGDSHADALQPAFKSLAQKYGITGWHASSPGCPPLMGVFRPTDPKAHECRQFNEAMLSIIQKYKIKHVILVGYWSAYYLGHAEWPYLRKTFFISDELSTQFGKEESERVFVRSFNRTLNYLQQNGSKVWVIAQVPELSSVPSEIARFIGRGKSIEQLATTKAHHRKRQKFVTDTFRDLQKKFKFEVIDPTNWLCPTDICRLVEGGRSIYRDNHHLSRFGAQLIRPIFNPIFQDAQHDSIRLSQKNSEKRAEQPFAADASIVHELKDPQDARTASPFNFGHL
jgi:peptidoglycan/LPS O-acetylase OafA/YrhL